MAQVLHMVFAFSDGKTNTVKIEDPKPGLSKEAVQAVMNGIVEKQAIMVTGMPVTSAKEAYIIETTKTQMF